MLPYLQLLTTLLTTLQFIFFLKCKNFCLLFQKIFALKIPVHISVLGEGSILMLLFGVIALTLFVLVGACVYRGWLMTDQRKHAEPSLFHPAPFNHVRYTQGLSSSDAPGLKD